MTTCDHDGCCRYFLCAHPKCCGYAVPSFAAASRTRPIPPAGLANACTECGDCFHPVVGPNTDGEPCEWCRDCGCHGDKHTRMTRVIPPASDRGASDA